MEVESVGLDNEMECKIKIEDTEASSLRNWGSILSFIKVRMNKGDHKFNLEKLRRYVLQILIQ